MKSYRRFNLFLDVPKRLLLFDPRAFFVYLAARRINNYTLLKFPALFELYEIIKTLEKENIPGGIVEMGSYQGGSGAFMAHYAERDVWLFDSFEGLPAPSAEDFAPGHPELDKLKMGYFKSEKKVLDEVLNLLSPSESKRVHVVEGWFEDTVPEIKKSVSSIALLHLDADLYRSTKYSLEQFYGQVSPGGFVVINDYKNWPGVRRALYEFFIERKITPELKFPWYGGVAFFRKEYKQYGTR